MADLSEWAGVVDSIIFTALHTNATELTWNCALGLGLEGIILGSILTQVYRYFEHFYKRDTRLTLCLVGLGTAGCLGQLAVNLWQTYLFIDKASTAVYLVLEKDVYADMVVLIMIGIYNLAAAMYFSRRAIKLVGHARIVGPPLIILCVTSFAMCIACVCQGFRIPTDTTTLTAWLETVNKYVIAWTAVALLTDVCVCGIMTYALVSSREEINAAATSLLRKLLMLTFETMLPPLIAVLIMLVYGCTSTATLGNFTRALGWIIGPLYFHAILHSLVGRHDVASLLENNVRDPILGGARHPDPPASASQWVGVGVKGSGSPLERGSSEGVLPLHRAWSSEKTLMTLATSESQLEPFPTRDRQKFGTPSPPRSRKLSIPNTNPSNGNEEQVKLEKIPVIPLVPVLMDQKAKQELGFEDENDFGISRV